LKKRAVILVIDSLGIGSMDDCTHSTYANTFAHILDKAKFISIKNMEKLGINRILNHKRLTASSETLASFGRARLLHEGADSYMGHQEIMGSKPLAPKIIPFYQTIDKAKYHFESLDYNVEVIGGGKCLLINNLIVAADNIETDFGQIYNVTAPLDLISFEEVLKAGRALRDIATVSRVISLGGMGISVGNIISAIRTTPEGATGVDCPKSGVYKKGYRVKHFGYGVNPEKQVSSILLKNGIPVYLIGKMADVIDCPGANYTEAIETDMVMYELISRFEKMDEGLIAATVQETDLSGHSQDIDRYAAKINTVDAYLGILLEKITENDLLIITADHGNDPTIGHNHHTREKVFLLAYSKGHKAKDLGERSTLSDVGATVCRFFGVSESENGVSFL